MSTVTALEISNHGHDFTNYLKETQCMGSFYENHPIMARCIFIPLAFVRGTVKPLFFLVRAIALSVIFPIIGAVRAIQGKSDACAYIKAGMLNFLGAAVVASFLMVSAYYMPLAASASIYIVATTVCITITVHRAAKGPEPRAAAADGPVI